MAERMRWFVGLAVVGAMLAGCRPCEKLDKKICADLGKERCAVWKNDLEKAGSPSATKASRNKRSIFMDLFQGPNAQVCENSLEHGTYSRILEGIETMVQAQSSGAGSVRD